MPDGENTTVNAAHKRVLLKRGMFCALGGLLLAGGAVGLLVPWYDNGSVSPKTMARVEVGAMFAEFLIRQEQHMLEHRSYLHSHVANPEANWWPISPSKATAKLDLLPLPSDWTDLKMQPNFESVHCSYVTVTGHSGDSTNIGPVAAEKFGYSAPKDLRNQGSGAWHRPDEVDVADWYYLLAHCDMDNDPAVDSYYFQSSTDREIQAVNQGH